MQRTILVTGASSGIGLAIARAAVDRGDRVFGTSRTATSCPDPRITLLPLDVRDERSVDECVAHVIERAGRLDVLVNNAGVMLFGPVEEVPLDEARALFETNLFGVARVTAAALPHLRRERAGVIVNVGSIAGSITIPMNGWYAASKHALVGYTEALRHEVAALGVRVHLAEPGDFASKLWDSARIVDARFDDYASLRANVWPRVRAMVSNAPAAEQAAREIVALFDDTRAPLRNAIGTAAKRLVQMRRFMPAAIFERGTRRRFGVA